eukprot:scaffold1785_cov247-Pinguiococcus_pyrenoidosus.AAC.18
MERWRGGNAPRSAQVVSASDPLRLASPGFAPGMSRPRGQARPVPIQVALVARGADEAQRRLGKCGIGVGGIRWLAPRLAGHWRRFRKLVAWGAAGWWMQKMGQMDRCYSVGVSVFRRYFRSILPNVPSSWSGWNLRRAAKRTL